MPVCFATTYGFSDWDELVIERDINKLYGKSGRTVKKAKLKCGEFFNEFKKSLAF